MAKVVNGADVQLENGYKSERCSEIRFSINGKHYTVKSSDVPINTTLNTFIRQNAQLTGTKFMCLEGGCGACIVTAYGKHPVTNEYQSWAINSCLTLVYACEGLNITTIEGVGNIKDGYDAVQKRLAAFHGTQCGYCSPGMVMNMHSLLAAKNGKVTMADVENSFGGNICRCTGYRPILDAFKSMATDADTKLKQFCPDIEDVPKICPKTGNGCNGNCASGTEKIKLVFDDGKEWYKIQNLKELFEIFSSIGTRPYQLIAGNTAHGVYRRDPAIEVFIDINNAKELHIHELVGNLATLGGNVSLTETMEIIDSFSMKTGFEYFSEIRKHIDLIANVPVRNAGTLAGNLLIKHKHNEFPSDLFLLLTTVGAEIVVADSFNSVVSLSPEDFLKTPMDHKIITKIIFKPLDIKTTIFRSYKVMPRAQNAHAYVNAAFLITKDSNVIVNAKLCFGGINPNLLNVTELENFLKGKDLHESNTLRASIGILEKSLNPDWELPDANPNYRKNLAISLFYKFVLETCPIDKRRPEFQSGGYILERPLSTGTQIFDTDKEKWPLTQPIQKVEGLIQSTGEAKYANDLPKQPGELWAVFVQATEVHSKIIHIDATEALKIKGFVQFISAKDIPGTNTFSPTNMMMMFEDEEIFCESVVKYNGQAAGMILADTLEVATEAAKKVKISYSKVGKQIYPTIKEVFENEIEERSVKPSVTIDPKVNVKNDGNVIKGKFEMAGQYHFTIEPQTAVCIPIEDGIELYSATQWVDLVQVAVAKCCNIKESSITLPLRRLGGGYGGKISRCAQIACACAVGTILTNRPVRLVLSLESNMEMIGKRFGVMSNYEFVVDDSGKIEKLINNFSQDLGCSINEQPTGHTLEFFKNCYNFDTWKVEGKGVITDSASNTWCRAPGTTEGIAMIENIMEHISRVVGKDPTEVRLANLEGDSKMKELMPKFLQQVDYTSRKKEIEKFNEKNRWRKRGIAVVPMKYLQGFFGAIPVTVSIFHSDGTVAIYHGGVECGQGINTKVLQVAAKTLNIPMEYIKIKPSINYTTPNSGVTGGSMTSEAVCYATLRACETLLERMEPVRAEMNGAKWHEITHACYDKMIELQCTRIFKMTDLQPYITWGLSCAEVEVDILTGNFQLTRVDILEDTGESMSPYIDVGQIEGAFVMGLGYWLSEYLIYDKNGKLTTNRSWNYKPPGAKDIPIDFRISFFRNSPNPLSILRSKATGEPALCMSIVAIFALRHAVDSARKDCGLNEWFSMGAPTTPEQVFMACSTKPDMLIL